VVVGVPLHMLRGWAFFGIMLQVRPDHVHGVRDTQGQALACTSGVRRDSLGREGCICCSLGLRLVSTATFGGSILGNPQTAADWGCLA
jgi:hypothetical protein